MNFFCPYMATSLNARCRHHRSHFCFVSCLPHAIILFSRSALQCYPGILRLATAEQGSPQREGRAWMAHNNRATSACVYSSDPHSTASFFAPLCTLHGALRSL